MSRFTKDSLLSGSNALLSLNKSDVTEILLKHNYAFMEVFHLSGVSGETFVVLVKSRWCETAGKKTLKTRCVFVTM